MPYAKSALSRLALPALLGLTLAAASTDLRAQSLSGSREKMLRQNMVAQEHDYVYLRTPSDLWRAVADGTLVRVESSEDLQLASGEVSYPYARPEVRNFLQQLAHGHRAECGEPLVVTSLTRPITRQPRNASPISVHPCGMAIDMRRSDRPSCRAYLDRTLLALQEEGMLEATLEHNPPHFHVAVFPDPLLLPAPIGDPDGVARLVAFHALTPAEQAVVEAADRSRGRLRISRSRRSGRLQITQAPRRIARHGRRGGVRYAVYRRPSAHRAVPAVLHRTHHPRAAHLRASHHGTHTVHAR